MAWNPVKPGIWLETIGNTIQFERTIRLEKHHVLPALLRWQWVIDGITAVVTGDLAKGDHRSASSLLNRTLENRETTVRSRRENLSIDRRTWVTFDTNHAVVYRE